MSATACVLNPSASAADSPATVEAHSSSTSSSSSQAAFEETRGPRVGIQLSLEDANLILQRHLDCTCDSLDYVDRGYNNRTYIAKASTGIEYVIRLCGRFWDRWKTEREVATLCYIRLRLPNGEIPVPRVYGFCSSRHESGIGYEYILMERMPGVPLENVWKTSAKAKPVLSVAEKKCVLAQIADVLHTLQSLRFKQIGCLTLSSSIGGTFGIGVDPVNDITLADIYVGPHTDKDIMAGPFDNYVDYEKAAILAAVADLKKTPYMASSLDLAPRIEEFIATQFRIDVRTHVFPDAAILHPPIGLVHGDFEPRNIMIDPESLRITGILDWEFSGAFPYYEDWFAGYEAFGALCDWAWTFELPPDEPEEYDPRTTEMTQNRELFFNALIAAGVHTPDQVPWLKLYSELWQFRWNISPWWLAETCDPPPAKWEDDKATARARVKQVLEKYMKDN